MSVKQEENRAVILGCLMAVVGGTVAAFLTYEVTGWIRPWEGWSSGAVILTAMPGAFVGGLMSSWAFGRAGLFGWGLVLVGGALATAVGATLTAGALMGMLGVVLGAAIVFDSLMATPLIGAAWLVLMAAAHLTMRMVSPYPELSPFRGSSGSL